MKRNVRTLDERLIEAQNNLVALSHEGRANSPEYREWLVKSSQISRQINATDVTR